MTKEQQRKRTNLIAIWSSVRRPDLWSDAPWVRGVRQHRSAARRSPVPSLPAGVFCDGCAKGRKTEQLLERAGLFGALLHKSDLKTEVAP